MFIWDFTVGLLLNQIGEWIYNGIVSGLGSFFEMMGNMGAELFEMRWTKAIVTLFGRLGWILFVTGIAVAFFETAIEYQNGRGSIRETMLDILKGFFAVNLFTTVPIELYKICVSLQGTFTSGIARLMSAQPEINGIGDMAKEMLSRTVDAALSPLMAIVVIILMAYSVFKVFFANLKRGGILLIMIAVASLYMFSVPRGHIDGFVGWCKQVIGICFTAFLQGAMLTAGLLVFGESMLLGVGVMLAAGEIPRIAGAFGVDTSTKASLNGAIHTAQSAVNFTRSIRQIVVK